MLMCLVLGRMRYSLAISRAPELSSKARQCTRGASAKNGKPRCLASRTTSINGMTSRSAVDSAMSSASLVDKAVIVCSLDSHDMGHPPYVMAYPVRDLDVTGSYAAVVGFHSPAKSAST